MVLGIIQDRDGKILVSQRSDPKIKEAHLKWDVPGGTNEFGESLKETLKREIVEETGLDAEVMQLLPECISKNWDHEEYLLHTLLLCYTCQYKGGNLQSKDHKINDLKWVSPQEALHLDLLSTTRQFIEIFNQKKMAEK